MSRLRRRQESFLRRRWRQIVALALLGVLAGGAAWLSHSGAIGRFAGNIHEGFLNKTANAGFAVKNLMVEGRVHADPEVLRALLGVTYGQSVFALDIGRKLEELSQVSWIEKAEIRRRLPDTIYVKVYERKPVAFWQREQRLSLIDANGTVITDENLDEFGTLPILVGGDAPEHARDLLQLLAAEPDIFMRVEAAVRVGQRRWDLKLNNDVRVKLPENDMALAIHMLSTLQKEDEIMDKGVAVIDLRLPEKLVVQMTPQAANGYQLISTGNGKNI